MRLVSGDACCDLPDAGPWAPVGAMLAIVASRSSVKSTAMYAVFGGLRLQLATLVTARLVGQRTMWNLEVCLNRRLDSDNSQSEHPRKCVNWAQVVGPRRHLVRSGGRNLDGCDTPSLGTNSHELIRGYNELT